MDYWDFAFVCSVSWDCDREHDSQFSCSYFLHMTRIGGQMDLLRNGRVKLCILSLLLWSLTDMKISQDRGMCLLNKNLVLKKNPWAFFTLNFCSRDMCEADLCSTHLSFCPLSVGSEVFSRIGSVVSLASLLDAEHRAEGSIGDLISPLVLKRLSHDTTCLDIQTPDRGGEINKSDHVSIIRIVDCFQCFGPQWGMKCLVNESPYKVRLALDGLVKTLGTLSFLIIIPIMQGLAEGEVKNSTARLGAPLMVGISKQAFLGFQCLRL